MYDPEEYEGLAQEVRVVGVVLSPVCYALGVRVELGIPPGLLRERGEVEEEKGVYGHVPRAVRRGSSGTVPPGESSGVRGAGGRPTRERITLSRERILREYVSRVRLRAISWIEGVPLTTVYQVRRTGVRAYSGLVGLPKVLKGSRGRPGSSTSSGRSSRSGEVRGGTCGPPSWTGSPSSRSGTGTTSSTGSRSPPGDVNYSDQYQVHQPGQARHGQGAHRGELQLPPQVD
jgi:hypothetical protein